MAVDIENKKLSIRAIKWDADKAEYRAVPGVNDCIDHYDDIKKSTKISMSGHTYYYKKKWHKYLNIEMDGEDRITDVTYEVKDPQGNTVTYEMDLQLELPHKALPHDLSEKQLSATYKRLLLNGKDCDHMSSSDIYRKGQ